MKGDCHHPKRGGVNKGQTPKIQSPCKRRAETFVCIVVTLLVSMSLMFQPMNSSIPVSYHKPVIDRKRPRYKSLLCVNDKNSTNCKDRVQLKDSISTKIIDYIIVGFPKSGTTTMGSILGYWGQAPIQDTCLDPHVTVYESYHQYSWTKSEQYGGIPADGRVNQNILTGIKCPAMLDYADGRVSEWSKYLPETTLIIGIRHPVLWFESFYNHLVKVGWEFKSPYQLMSNCDNNDECKRGCPKNGVLCLHRSKFHLALARLGKTPLSQAERQWLPIDVNETIPNYHVKNDVFLYEISQLSEETNKTRSDVFWQDLAQVLDFPHKIPHNVSVKPAGHLRSDSEIDICNGTYAELRRPLMECATQMSHWICEYFIKSDEVFVSSPDDFCETLEGWKEEDPCVRARR